MPKNSWNRVEPTILPGQTTLSAVPIACLSGSVPVVVDDCVASALEPVQWTLLEQWSARCIMEVGDFVNAADIGGFLGLQPVFVEPALKTLAENGLVHHVDGHLAPTPALAEAMRKGTHRKATEKRFRSVRAPATNLRLQPSEGDGLKLAPDSDASEPSRPDPVELRKWASAEHGPLAGLEVVSIEVKSSRPFRLPVEVRIFVDHDGSQWGWDVYERGTENRRQDLRKACEDEGCQEQCRKVVEAHVVSDPEEPAPPPEALEYVPLHRVKAGAADIVYLEAHAAQNRVVDLIRQAKEEIVMFFPWIKSAGLRHMESHLRSALDRGVAVLIGYGIASRPEDEQSHADVVARLGSLRSKQGHAVVAVRWLGSSHTKEMVIDRKHYLHGSHNMLSFVGDKREGAHGIRRELMSVDSNRERFWPAFHNLRGFFLSRRVPHDTTHRLGDLCEWVVRWQAPLQLGAGPAETERALRECPADDLAIETATRLVLLGLEHQDAQPSSACIDSLVAWLAARAAGITNPTWRARIHKNASRSVSIHQAHLKDFGAKMRDAGIAWE